MDEVKVGIPDSVGDTELIDRILYEPSFFCEGRLAPSAFALTRDKETYISVFRNSYYNLEDIQLPKPRTPGDSATGIAQLKTDEVRRISSPNPANVMTVSVDARKTKAFPFHAGIFTKIDNVPITSGNAHTTPLFMYVQKELVHLSKVVLLKEDAQA